MIQPLESKVKVDTSITSPLCKQTKLQNLWDYTNVYESNFSTDIQRKFFLETSPPTPLPPGNRARSVHAVFLRGGVFE